MSKDIIIELTRDHGTDVKGARYGVPSVAVADKLYENYKVISHTDGSDYEAPAPRSTKTAPKATKAATETIPVAPEPTDDVPAGDAA